MKWPFSFISTDETASDSHIGGTVKLPQSLSVVSCEYCRAEMPLFFKVSLQNTFQFRHHHLLVFACVSCAQHDRLIPKTLDDPLHGKNIDADFLNRNQTNFRLILLKEDSLPANVVDVTSPIRRRNLSLDANGTVRCGREIFGKAGGSPAWILEDESPGKCQGNTSFEFVFQLTPNRKFETVKGAPAQKVLSLEGKPMLGDPGSYDLFVGNACYFFATHAENGLVYVVTQVD